jgi:hypothetical protein
MPGRVEKLVNLRIGQKIINQPMLFLPMKTTALALLIASLSVSVMAQVRITEFMASNASTLAVRSLQRRFRTGDALTNEE